MSQLYDGLPVPRGLTYPPAPSQAPSASIAFSEAAIDLLFFGLRICYVRDTNVLNLFPDILYLMYSFSQIPHRKSWLWKRPKGKTPKHGSDAENSRFPVGPPNSWTRLYRRAEKCQLNAMLSFVTSQHSPGSEHGQLLDAVARNVLGHLS